MIKIVSAFYVSREGKNGPIYGQPCIECKKPKMRANYHRNQESLSQRALVAWHALSPAEKQMKNLLKRYDMTLAEYDAMYAEQSGQCMICKTDKPSRGRDRLVVDHDHHTGEVRALLCHKCNRGIGFLNDDPELALRASLYLERS